MGITNTMRSAWLTAALLLPSSAMADEREIPKFAVMAAVAKGMTLPAEEAGQLRKPQNALSLANPRGVSMRRDDVAQNTQYLPIPKGQGPRGLARAELEDALRRYLASQRQQFKVDPSTLVPADRPTVALGSQVIISLKQQVGTAAVETALVQATFVDENPGGATKGQSYRLVDITNQTFGELDLPALTASLADLGDDPLFQQMAILERQDVITPVYENGQYNYKPGRRFLVEDQSTSKQYRVSVGNDGKMRHAISQFQSFQGEISATVFERGYFNNIKTTAPLKHALIGGTFTNGAGFISLPDGDYTLSLFSGGQLGEAPIGNPERRINIIDFQGTPNPAGFRTQVSLSGGSVNLGELSNSAFTAVNTFVALNRIWDFALVHLDGVTNTDGLEGNEVAFLSGGINVLVNQPIINPATRCNAFFNPNNNSLNFFVANAPCGNFGQLNDVIYHEWGHALDNAVGPSRGITDGAFSEGLSDVISGYFTGDSRVAPGFTTNNLNGGLRDLNNRSRLNDTSLAGVHAQGTIIGGAFWDLRNNLRTRYGASGINLAEKLFFQHLLITDTMVQSYTNVLRLDDNDGDLTNGTPNFCLINDAFARHGLTTAQGCQDQLPQLRVQVLDQTVDGRLMLELSLPAGEGTAPAICLSSNAECRSQPSRDIPLELVENPLAEASSRVVYRTVQGVPVPSGSALTFSVLILRGNGSLSDVETLTLQSR